MVKSLPVLLLLGACTGDISNDLFIEDATFRAALPDPAQLGVAWPVALSLPEEIDPDPFLLRGLLDSMAATRLWVELLSGAVQPALTGTPSARGDDYRVWGPYPYDAYPEYFLRVEMSRTSNASLYTFSVGVSNASSGPWREFFTGTRVADPTILSGWNGELVWDASRLSEEIPGQAEGRVSLRYATAEPRLVELEVVDWQEEGDTPSDSLTSFALTEDGGGRLEQVGDLDLGGGEAREHAQAIGQWLASGEGRADAVFSAGDLDQLRPAPSQCWGADGAVVWQQDLTGTWPTVGEDSACAEGLVPGEPDAL